MPVFHHQQKVSYSALDMFNLVNDVAAYQDFLPGCQESHILSQTEDQMDARLVLSGGGFTYTLTTRNSFQKPSRIAIELIKGPFKHLTGTWTFTSQNTGCIISLNVSFAFSNRLLSVLFESVFHQIANRLMRAFEERAKACYG